MSTNAEDKALVEMMERNRRSQRLTRNRSNRWRYRGNRRVRVLLRKRSGAGALS